MKEKMKKKMKKNKERKSIMIYLCIVSYSIGYLYYHLRVVYQVYLSLRVHVRFLSKLLLLESSLLHI